MTPKHRKHGRIMGALIRAKNGSSSVSLFELKVNNIRDIFSKYWYPVNFFSKTLEILESITPEFLVNQMPMLSLV